MAAHNVTTGRNRWLRPGCPANTKAKKPRLESIYVQHPVTPVQCNSAESGIQFLIAPCAVLLALGLTANHSKPFRSALRLQLHRRSLLTPGSVRRRGEEFPYRCSTKVPRPGNVRYPNEGVLHLTATDWSEFLAAVKRGDFDQQIDTECLAETSRYKSDLRSPGTDGFFSRGTSRLALVR